MVPIVYLQQLSSASVYSHYYINLTIFESTKFWYILLIQAIVIKWARFVSLWLLLHVYVLIRKTGWLHNYMSVIDWSLQVLCLPTTLPFIAPMVPDSGSERMPPLGVRLIVQCHEFNYPTPAVPYIYIIVVPIVYLQTTELCICILTLLHQYHHVWKHQILSIHSIPRRKGPRERAVSVSVGGYNVVIHGCTWIIIILHPVTLKHVGTNG